MLLAISSMEFLQWAVQESLGGDTPEHPLNLYQVAARAAVVFLMGLAIVRIGKNRLISRVTSIDVLFGFLLGSLLSRAITGHAALSGTAVASASIAAVHWLLSFLSYRSHAFGTVVKGRETLVVRDGEPVSDNLRRAHISSHDLEEGLRLQGVGDIQQAHRVYQERNGEISVLKDEKPPTVLEVSVREGVQIVRIQVS